MSTIPSDGELPLRGSMLTRQPKPHLRISDLVSNVPQAAIVQPTCSSAVLRTPGARAWPRSASKLEEVPVKEILDRSSITGSMGLMRSVYGR